VQPSPLNLRIMLASHLVLFRRSLNIPAIAACRYSLCSDQDWSRRGEDASVGLSRWSLGMNELWISQSRLEVLLALLSQNLVVWLHRCLDDVDGIASGTVSTSHLGVHLGDSSAEGVTSVLFVHVHNTSSGKILKHDSVVPDGTCFSFEDFADGDDLTLALSNLVLSFHLIPELRSGEDSVLGENSDSEAGWFRLSFTC